MHLSGAKAHVDFAAFTARLKSCPVTKPLYTRSEFALAFIDFPTQESPLPVSALTTR